MLSSFGHSVPAVFASFLFLVDSVFVYFFLPESSPNRKEYNGATAFVFHWESFNIYMGFHFANAFGSTMFRNSFSMFTQVSAVSWF